jgi:hypothetical protein
MWARKGSISWPGVGPRPDEVASGVVRSKDADNQVDLGFIVMSIAP